MKRVINGGGMKENDKIKISEGDSVVGKLSVNQKERNI
jgi:translation initiation factor IF-1